MENTLFSPSTEEHFSEIDFKNTIHVLLPQRKE